MSDREQVPSEKKTVAKAAERIEYMRLATRHKLYGNVMSKLAQLGVPRKTLAARLSLSESVIDELLSSPQMLTLEKASDVLLAIGCEIDPSIRQFGHVIDDDQP